MHRERETIKNIQTKLHARGIKKGSLRKNLENAGVDDIKVTRKNSSPKSKSSKSSINKSSITNSKKGGVSPTLAQWAASTQSSSTENTVTSTSSTSTSTSTTISTPEPDANESTATEFTNFTNDENDIEEGRNKKNKKNQKNKSERRSRQAQRKEEENQIRKKVQSTISSLESLLEVESNRDVDGILQKIRDLTDMTSESVGSSMKALCLGAKRINYRMIWAGSDEAICHVGTGLHKVPLARLEEIFMTIGKSRMEMYEVIRILGPFPNVKNILKGDVATMKSKTQLSQSQPVLQICYDSMIDGTGKEILAGKEENTRAVEVLTLFASEDIIVCQTPGTSKNENDKEDPYENGIGVNGSNLLLFALEEDMETKLKSLRVA